MVAERGFSFFEAGTEVTVRPSAYSPTQCDPRVHEAAVVRHGHQAVDDRPAGQVPRVRVQHDAREGEQGPLLGRSERPVEVSLTHSHSQIKSALHLLPSWKRVDRSERQRSCLF